MRSRAVGRFGGHVFLRAPGSHLGRFLRVGAAEKPSLGGCGAHGPDTGKIVFRGGRGRRRGLRRSWLLSILSVQSGGGRYSREPHENERANTIPHTETLPWSKDCATRNLGASDAELSSSPNPSEVPRHSPIQLSESKFRWSRSWWDSR